MGADLNPASLVPGENWNLAGLAPEPDVVTALLGWWWPATSLQTPQEIPEPDIKRCPGSCDTCVDKLPEQRQPPAPHPSGDEDATEERGWGHCDVYSAADGEAGNWPAGRRNSQSMRAYHLPSLLRLSPTVFTGPQQPYTGRFFDPHWTGDQCPVPVTRSYKEKWLRLPEGLGWGSKIWTPQPHFQ